MKVSSPSSMFPQCNIANVTLHQGKKNNPERYKYFSQSQRHSFFKMSGQLLQKEKKHFPTKGRNLHLRELRRRLDTTLSSQDGHRLHVGQLKEETRHH